ncbi:MAG: glycyl-radical enzyme activating protein [Peptostreptococcaceae bacterium]|nr:glycyl-radical enzyme activating protein [Peptostreptococcaceae bacterium]
MIVLNIQRMSTEDGPGLRTTLFLKGCPLKCKWCHNPESISLKPKNEWIEVRCIGCGSCVAACKQGAISIIAVDVILDNEKCIGCKKCIDACPTGALEVKGEYKTVDELYDEIIKDRAYWGDNGGVTLSGGELLMQSKEAALLLACFKSNGIHTAVDTCGYCKKSDIDNVLQYTDLFLYDLKIFDSDKHKEFTGHSNERIIENFNYIVGKIKGTDKKIWIRTPIIPNSTDDIESIRNIAKLIKGKVEKWEMCAFNNLCRDKYERLYEDWEYKKEGLVSREKMDELLAVALAEGVENATWTGVTK